MSLKAGRRGLRKRLVDAFGNLNSEALGGEYYTKQQTDNKFETKTHVNNTFQKKTLEVPLEMLSGSKLTVEDALQGLNEEKFTYADNGVLGAKNINGSKYRSVVNNGVTFTTLDSGEIQANGTASGGDAYDNAGISFGFVADFTGQCIFSGGISEDAYVYVYDYTILGRAYTDVTKTTISGDADGFDKPVYIEKGHVYNLILRVVDTKSVSNVVFKPMLRLASDTDDTYVPYAMTNREITEELTVQESAVTDIIEGATVGDTGNYLYKQGKIVWLTLRLNGVTTTAWADDTPICMIPEGFRPKKNLRFVNSVYGNEIQPIQINVLGKILSAADLSNQTVILTATWITD